METQEKFTKLLNTDIIAVEVPKTAESIIKKGSKICYYEHAGAYSNEKEIDLGFDFEILGEATEDSISFDVEPYVSQNEFDIETYEGLLVGFTKFWDYENDGFYFHDKDESFRSLLQASGLNWVNQIGKNEPIHLFSDNAKKEESKMYQNALKNWKEAESKLIKGKLIFLKIVK